MLASSGDAAAVMNFTAGRRLQDWLRYIQHFDCHAFTKKSCCLRHRNVGEAPLVLEKIRCDLTVTQQGRLLPARGFHKDAHNLSCKNHGALLSLRFASYRFYDSMPHISQHALKVHRSSPLEQDRDVSRPLDRKRSLSDNTRALISGIGFGGIL